MKTIKELCDFLLPHIEHEDSYVGSFFVCDTDWANMPEGEKVIELEGQYKKAFFRAFGGMEYLDWCILPEEEDYGLSIGFVVSSEALED